MRHLTLLMEFPLHLSQVHPNSLRLWFEQSLEWEAGNLTHAELYYRDSVTMNCTWDKSQLPNSFKIVLTFSIHCNFLQYCEIPLKFFHDRQIYFPWGCEKWLSTGKFSFDSQTVAWFVRETRGISSCSWSVCLPVKTAELVDCLRAILEDTSRKWQSVFPLWAGNAGNYLKG